MGVVIDLLSLHAPFGTTVRHGEVHLAPADPHPLLLRRGLRERHDRHVRRPLLPYPRESFRDQSSMT